MHNICDCNSIAQGIAVSFVPVEVSMLPEACITNPVEVNLATQYDYYQYIPLGMPEACMG